MLGEFKIGTIEEYVEAIKQAWKHNYGTFRYSKIPYYGETDPPKGNGFTLELHTGGWSENEEIVQEIEKSFFSTLYYVKWERGGHYYFGN